MALLLERTPEPFLLTQSALLLPIQLHEEEDAVVPLA
jgi:hypothetical protein